MNQINEGGRAWDPGGWTSGQKQGHQDIGILFLEIIELYFPPKNVFIGITCLHAFLIY